MSVTLKSLFLCVFVLVVSVLPARADYFVWEDAKTGLSLSFPDSWDMTSNADPDDVITLMAPSDRGYASCRVRARDEGRYLIYPPRLSGALRDEVLNLDFWKSYLAEYDHIRIYDHYQDAGLGRGYASMVTATYNSAVPGPDMRRKALIFASLYHDKLFIFECSVKTAYYKDWAATFLSIAKSVDFKKTHHELWSGNYYNFIDHNKVAIPSAKRNHVVYY